MSTKAQYFHYSLIAILAALIFIPLYGASPNIWPDTSSYLNFDSTRPPVYPLFLWLFHSFGKDQLVAVMWAQGIINFLVFIYADQWMSNRLGLSKTLVFLILLLPTIIFILHFEMLKNIGTEAVSFPLFILTVTLFVDCFHKYEIKKLISLVIVTNLLILTREQFYYFYALFILLSLWYFWKQIPHKKLGISIAVLFLSILMTGFANREYHYFVNHQFSDASSVGELFAIQAFYLAKNTDEKYFNEATEKTIFTNIMRQLEADHLTKDTAPSGLYPPMPLDVARTHFDLVHDQILQVTRLSLPAGMTNFEASSIFLDISKKLYRYTWKTNINFYIWRVAYFVGGIWIFSGLLIILSTFLFGALLHRKWAPSTTQIFIAISIFAILANAAFVPLFAHYEMRYCYYSYFLYFILCALVGKSFLNTHIGKEKG